MIPIQRIFQGRLSSTILQSKQHGSIYGAFSAFEESVWLELSRSLVTSSLEESIWLELSRLLIIPRLEESIWLEFSRLLITPALEKRVWLEFGVAVTSRGDGAGSGLRLP